MILPRRLTKDIYLDDAQLDVSEKHIETPCTPHWHEFFELELVLSGNISCHHNGIPYSFTPGSAILSCPSDTHAYTPHGKTVVINISFSEHWLHESLLFSLFQAQKPLITNFSGDSMTKFTILCKTILSEYKTNKLFYERAMQNLLEYAVITMLRAADINFESKNFSINSIQRALLYIKSHFREQITLKDIATQVGFSTTYFSEKFHASVGESFQSYLLKMRCEYAQQLLAHTDTPITEICYACGFSSLSHFHRSFKSFSGLSPREWRKQQNNTYNNQVP